MPVLFLENVPSVFFRDVLVEVCPANLTGASHGSPIVVANRVVVGLEAIILTGDSRFSFYR